MKGNDKIAFTAEAVSLMRAIDGSEPFSKYFVSDEIQNKFNAISKIIPKSYLDKIFARRVSLSKDLDKLIQSYKPEQIIELACGYSPRGIVMTQKNPKLVYIETDFSKVISRKRKIFKEIESKEKIKLSKNHHLVNIDAIDADLYSTLKNLISKDKKTLVVAETLTSYLNPEEHEFLIKNIISLLNKLKHGAYLSHEGKTMLPGFFGKLLLFYRDKIAKTKSHKHFKEEKAIETYFKEKEFKNTKIVDSKASNNILYLANWK